MNDGNHYTGVGIEMTLQSPEKKIFIILKNNEPVCLGSFSGQEFKNKLHDKIWEKAHKKSLKNGISLLKSLRIQIKRAGFEPEEVRS